MGDLRHRALDKALYRAQEARPSPRKDRAPTSRPWTKALALYRPCALF